MSPITLTINGEPHQVKNATTLLDFLAQEKIEPRTVAVEHNGTVLFRREWGTIQLRDGDRLEIVRAVAGG